ncbi:hypothetical protein OGAPHI_000117 [Ogataea philodendri]|uniref:Uncharacterized protein n=1 Tax=Ogataea philodendri TaxID=1378263 RepID=A0A9P8TBA2_9ASCO|nr:uncharacterized protein OGAPHI_000117 [Ogataea philodendri]KAH3671931.1 hypothetical protein OGAPHI_000117 [Ogataea philodendri]
MVCNGVVPDLLFHVTLNLTSVFTFSLADAPKLDGLVIVGELKSVGAGCLFSIMSAIIFLLGDELLDGLKFKIRDLILKPSALATLTL